MTHSVLRVVTYHRLVAPHAAELCNPSLISATPAAFAAQMRYLARRYRVVSAEEVAAAYRTGRLLPARAVLVTFDDAYRDVGEVAWPILRRLGLPATVFVPTAYPDGGRAFWWDRLHLTIGRTAQRELAAAPLGRLALRTAEERRASLRALQAHVKALPHAAAMRFVDDVCDELGPDRAPPADVHGWDELRQLASDGMTIGAHTRTHPALDRLPIDEAREEIVASRDDLRREIGRTPLVFAYPFGAHDAGVVEAVREAGFELAVTCLDGHNAVPQRDPLRLDRTNVTPRTSLAVFKLRLSPVGARLDRLRHRGAAQRAPAAPLAAGAPAASARPVTIAYIVSRFPKLTETFVLNEVVALEALGVRVALHPLLRERQAVRHPEAERWTQRARFLPFVSGPILRAQLHYLRRRPRTYLGVLRDVVRGTWGSANFLAGALAFFPKSVRFAYEMDRDGVAHVHAHFCSHPALAAFVIHRLTGIPYSFTAHGSDLHVERRMLDAKLAGAAFAVTISRFNKRVMTDACGEALGAKVHVIHCGVDLEAFTVRPAERAEGPVRLLCVGSFEEVKGHRHLIDACALLRARAIDFVCDLVGEGPLRREMEQRIARLDLGDRVRVLGGRPRPEVIRMFRAADVAVLASQPTREGKREGIPVVLMEAMASGLPVVSSILSGIPELVDQESTGLLVPPADAVALADALERLARDPALRQRMGAAGRAKVAREFDLRANTTALLDLFVATEEARRRIATPFARTVSDLDDSRKMNGRYSGLASTVEQHACRSEASPAVPGMHHAPRAEGDRIAVPHGGAG